MYEPRCRICGRGLRTGLAHIPDPLLPGDIPDANELCTQCQAWTEHVIGKFIDGMREAIMAAAADIPPTTLHLWHPAPPENRRLPMPLEYA